MVDDLGKCYETFQELRQDIEKVVILKKPFSNKSYIFQEKLFLIQTR